MSEGRPAGRIVALAAVLAALLAAVLTGQTTAATLLGLGSVALLGASQVRASRPLASVAAVGLFGATVLAASADAGAGQLLAAGVATLLAWTFAHAAVDLRRSVATAPTRDHELAHIAGTSALVAGAAVPGYLVYTIEWGSVPPLAVALLLVAAVSLTAALRRHPDRRQ